jgi:hypothetical protein
MVHRWECISFLHWAYHVETVQRLLPPGLWVEPYDGMAWVGLVPFHMYVRPPLAPPVPWASYFPETNLRTYVRDANGHTGVWFFSLDASRFGAIVAARATLGLPYFWSRMRLGRRGDVVRYRSTRRWPGPTPAHNDVEVEVGPRIAEPSAFENYLTARFALFSPKLLRVPAHHPPWPLHAATVRRVDTGLLAAAGLPDPPGRPVAHYSDGVQVRIGLPERSG